MCLNDMLEISREYFRVVINKFITDSKVAMVFLQFQSNIINVQVQTTDENNILLVLYWIGTVKTPWPLWNL